MAEIFYLARMIPRQCLAYDHEFYDPCGMCYEYIATSPGGVYQEQVLLLPTEEQPGIHVVEYLEGKRLHSCFPGVFGDVHVRPAAQYAVVVKELEEGERLEFQGHN